MDVAQKVVVLPTVEDVGTAMQHFQWPDYVMFSIMLMVCVIIGIYFGIYRSANTVQEYLMGGRNMDTFPVTMSLIASFVSGISLLGIPTETYLYGIQYINILVGLAVMTLIFSHVYLPVFYRLSLTSLYEYLERRFDKRVRVYGTLLFTINMTIWLPIVIYVPALAFNHVTGVNVHLVTPIICVICIFYTSLGGLRAVIWTDMIQAAIMFGAMMLVAIKGTLDIGGLEVVTERNIQSGRIEAPNLTFFSQERYTFWSLSIGGGVYLLEIAAINQTMLQRYLSLPSLTSAKKAVWFFCLGLSLVVLICGYCGVLIYATYYKCDPLATKLAREKDQLLPLLVMQVLGDYSSLPGIFVAGLLSASLSSLSTGLNAMAAVTLEDFYPFFFTKPLTEKQSALLMRLTVIIYGTICVALVYIIEHLGSVLQVSMSIGSIASGSSLGMFTTGVLLPWVNAKGALAGGVSSLLFMCWVCFKAQSSILAGELSFPEKPLSTEGCRYHFVPQPTHVNVSLPHPEEKFVLHHVSYLWYTLIGTFISVVVGLLTSVLTKQLDPCDVDSNLLSPCILRFIKPRQFPNQPRDSIIYAFDQRNAENCREMEALSRPE